MKRKSTFIKKGTISDQSTLAKFGIIKKANVTKPNEESTSFVEIKKEQTEHLVESAETDKEENENYTKRQIEENEADIEKETISNSSVKEHVNKSRNIPATINKCNNFVEEKESIKIKIEKIPDRDTDTERDRDKEKWKEKEKEKGNVSSFAKNNTNKKDNPLLPLYKQIEPTCKEEFIHVHRGKKNPFILQLLNEDIQCNLVIYGPPGSGKSSLINVLKNKTNNSFVNFIHLNNFGNEIKKIYDQSLSNFKMFKKKTIVCVKDINRLNKSQQENLLLVLKKGYIILLATCLENPMNNLNSALVSRCMILHLPPYQYDELKLILNRGMNKLNIKIDEEAMKILIDHSSGDARVAINILEFTMKVKDTIHHQLDQSSLSSETLTTTKCVDMENTKDENNPINDECTSDRNLSEYKTNVINDKDIRMILQNFPSTDSKLDHHSFMSALQKCIRAGNTKAAILYLMKSLQNGEDPIYICRRLIRIASEDIGIANNEVLSVCVNTHYACKAIGMPECQTSLIYAVIVLCRSAKSNYVYLISDFANKICEQYKFSVPFNLKNASDKYVYTNQPEILSFDEHIQKYKDVQKYLPSHMEDVNLLPIP